MKRYLHQIIFCSDRIGRAYRREITVTDRIAMVTNVEMLPPHYEIPMERMRDENEDVSQYAGELRYFSEYRGCPFCGAQSIFICDCGYLSCRNMDARPVHTCPKCSGIFNTRTAESLPMSKSGLVHGKEQGQLRGGPSGPPVMGSPDRKKEIARMNLQKFLEEQTKKQLEDKRNKD